jgi:dGTPase
VDELEDRYATFRGLNLTFETREGILKHCSLNNARQLAEVGERFIKRQQPTLEAQIANVADEIAYNNHDLDDGLRAGLITIEELLSVASFARQHDIVRAAYGALDERRAMHEIVRRMVNRVVSDLIESTQAAIAAAAPSDVEAVRARSATLVTFGTEVAAEHVALKQFLRDRVYRHYRVLRMTNKAQNVVRSLFAAFFERPELLPDEHRDAASTLQAQAGDAGRARAVADYIAGMTDRYAITEHERLFDPAKRS